MIQSVNNAMIFSRRTSLAIHFDHRRSAWMTQYGYYTFRSNSISLSSHALSYIKLLICRMGISLPDCLLGQCPLLSANQLLWLNRHLLWGRRGLSCNPSCPHHSFLCKISEIRLASIRHWSRSITDNNLSSLTNAALTD